MLEKLKILLGIAEDDSRDAFLSVIIDETAQRLSYRFLAGCEVPEELEYIVIAVSVVRFNRIGSEGMTKQNIEGEDQTFMDDDFAPYLKEISGWLDQQDEIETSSGVVRFL